MGSNAILSALPSEVSIGAGPHPRAERERESRYMLTARRTIQIEWGDCDAAGTVFFPRYLEYGDASRTDYLRRLGCSKP